MANYGAARALRCPPRRQMAVPWNELTYGWGELPGIALAVTERPW